MSYNIGKLKINFSLKREVFFVVLGSLRCNYDDDATWNDI